MDELKPDLDALTEREIEALRIAEEPRAVRGAICAALGISRQSLSNRVARARRKLAQARAARLRAA